jgi:hypothetical protein
MGKILTRRLFQDCWQSRTNKVNPPDTSRFFPRLPSRQKCYVCLSHARWIALEKTTKIYLVATTLAATHPGILCQTLSHLSLHRQYPDNVHRSRSGRNYPEPIARLRDSGVPEADVARLAYDLLSSGVVCRHWSSLLRTSKCGCAKYDYDHADSTSDQPTALAVEFAYSYHDRKCAPSVRA